MAYLGARPSSNFRVAPTKDTFTGDGSTTTFDLANKVPAGGENALQVFVENVRQEPGSGKAYTLGADGSGDLKRITFSSAPASSAEIYVITTFSNEAFSNLDLNGSELQLDADGDTTITADTDDQIDIKIAGADDFQFTANTFTAQAGSSIVIPEGGLTLGSTAVSSTAAELNLLDGVSGLVQADLTKLAAVDATAAELNLLDGSAKSTSSITVADSDAIIVIDGTTTKQIPASDIKTYVGGFDVSSITGATALTTQPAADDEIVISDAGTLKRLDIKHIQATPAFAAQTSSTTATAHNTYTKVQCDSEILDSDGTYDNSSNYRFTPGVAGKYFIFGMVAQGSGTGVNNMERQYTAIYKNGSKVMQSVHDGRNNAFGDTFSGTCTIILDLDADDYVELYTKPLDSGSANCNYYTDSTCFGGYRIAGV